MALLISEALVPADPESTHEAYDDRRTIRPTEMSIMAIRFGESAERLPLPFNVSLCPDGGGSQVFILAFVRKYTFNVYILKLSQL